MEGAVSEHYDSDDTIPEEDMSAVRKRTIEDVEVSEEDFKPKREKSDLEPVVNDPQGSFTECKAIKENVLSKEFKACTTSQSLVTNELDIPDLKDIIDILKQGYFPYDKWSSLGLNLGLLQPTLSVIETNYKGDVERCLCECLTQWLHQSDNVYENGGATLDSLASALEKIGENAVAIKIQKFQALSASACEILVKHRDSLSSVNLPTEIVHLLFSEKIISNETLVDVTKLGGVLRDESLRALSTTVRRKPNSLKTFGNVLKKSKQTILIGKSILKDCDYKFPVQISVSPCYQYDFDKMKVAFGNLFDTVAPLIKTGIPSLKELKKYIERCFRELKPQLAIAESFDDVMDVVQEKCSIVNVCCLEAIVDRYNIAEAKQHIDKFNRTIDTFCEKVKAEVCQNQNFMIAPSSHHLICETIEFILEWEVDECTLADINGLLSKAFKDSAKRIIVRDIRQGSSVIVTCYAPHNMMDILVILAEENLHVLKDIGLIKLSIGYYVVYDKRKIDEELQVFQSDVENLQYKVKSQDTTITEMITEKKGLEFKLQRKEGELIVLKEEILNITESKESEIAEMKKMNKAKTLQIEKLVNDLRQKEGTQQDVEELQEIITSLSLQLRERDKQIENHGQGLKDLVFLVKSEERVSSEEIQKRTGKEQEHTSDIIESTSDDEKESDHEMSEEGDVKWYDDINKVDLTKPTIEQCEGIVIKIKEEQTAGNEPFSIELRSSSLKSALLIIQNLNECGVKGFDIYNTPLDNICTSTLSEVLKINKTMKRLYLSSSPLSGGIKPVTIALSDNDSLKELSFYNFTLTEDDISDLYEMLCINTILKELYLYNCDITDKGIQYICEGLLQNQTLTVLSISYNYLITSLSTKSLIELIDSTTSLAELRLYNTSLKSHDVKLICDALARTDTVQRVGLSRQHRESVEKLDSYELIKQRLLFW